MWVAYPPNRSTVTYAPIFSFEIIVVWALRPRSKAVHFRAFLWQGRCCGVMSRHRLSGDCLSVTTPVNSNVIAGIHGPTEVEWSNSEGRIWAYHAERPHIRCSFASSDPITQFGQTLHCFTYHAKVSSICDKEPLSAAHACLMMSINVFCTHTERAYHWMHQGIWRSVYRIPDPKPDIGMTMVGGPGFNRASDSGVCQATSPIMQCSCLSTLISLAYCSKRKCMMANVCEYIRQEAGRNRDEHTLTCKIWYQLPLPRSVAIQMHLPGCIRRSCQQSYAPARTCTRLLNADVPIWNLQTSKEKKIEFGLK